MFQNLLQRLFGSRQSRIVKRYQPFVDAINAEVETLAELSDDDLKAKTPEFRARLAAGETPDDLLVEALAVVKEACRRLLGQSWDVAGQPQTWDMVPYDVQLIGGIALHQGRIAEMATGEGKTLVAVAPLYLNALTGKGAHLVTVNDYLALRDSHWMGGVFRWLGVTVGVIQQGQSSAERRAAYEADVTYGTNNEFGFDYLRDNMAIRADDRVQRPHHYAIVDEVDSVLIDEARTPLIISGPVESDTQRFDELKSPVQRLFAKQRELVNNLVAEAEKELKKAEEAKDDDGRWQAGRKLLLVQRGAPKNRRFMKLLAETGVKKLITDVESDFMREKTMHELDEELFYTIDERRHNTDLMEKGRQVIAPKNPDLFVLPDLADELTRIDSDESLDEAARRDAKEELHRTYDDRAERLQNLGQLLKAYSLYEKDVNYVLQEGKVVIVDEFTGRMMPGRRFSDGLHQALEAKEGVRVERDNQTLATITLQNYFRMYEKLAGMTGTAETEEGEFGDIYDLDVVVIPTNRPVVRVDHEDQLYRTKREKFNAVIDEIEELHQVGQPVLVGTTSVETSELISRMLKRKKVPHSVLNAKYHHKEAEIVTKAGLRGAVTIATNMAGRGTDIKLGEGVKDLGGLHIIGTERHEARRIDRQLRGRSGRQGDAGSSRFYLSLEDDLMRLFQSERMATIMDKLGVEEGEVIEHSFMTKAIERAQKRVEEQNFGIRKHLLEYDNVMNKQREIIYGRRLQSLEGKDLEEECKSLVQDIAAATVDEHTVESGSTHADDWDFALLRQEFGRRLGVDFDFEAAAHAGARPEELREQAAQAVLERYEEREGVAGPDLFRQFERFVTLTTIDANWKDHLYGLDRVREGIGLRAYGQKDPLLEYKKEAFQLFSELMDRLDLQTAERLMKTEIRLEAPRPVAVPAGVAHQPSPEAAGAVAGARAAVGAGVAAGGGPPPPPGPRSGARLPSLPPSGKRGGGGGDSAFKNVGRNDPCPCGSGKKFKKCHGRGA
jgi:preprotein translocase subunit SecA